MSKCRFRVKEYPAERSDGIKLFILSNKNASMVYSNEKQPDLKSKQRKLNGVSSKYTTQEQQSKSTTDKKNNFCSC